jgi:hypothetical protein
LKNVILIDFENVQPQNPALIRGRPFAIKIFVGATQTKIPTDLVTELQPLGPEVEYIRIQGTGRNALDFHIAYYIGRLSAEFPDAVFHIISKDTGFDPLIRHLTATKISCHRWASLAQIPGLKAVHDLASERIEKIAINLLNRKDSRPRKLSTLTAFIKGQLNTHGSEAAVGAAIERLKLGGLVILQDGKVSYPSVSALTD